MKRKKYFNKIIAITFAIIFLQSLFEPYYALALSGGGAQIEFTSYESASSSDMVQLLTGDFNYSVPVMTVPGPEGGYTIPLFYNAGITNEQDASWVGLGWNINVGSISRDIVGYPDDAFDNPISINANDPGGSSYFKNFILFYKKWDSNKGSSYGQNLYKSFELEWSKNGLHFDLTLDKDNWAQYVTFLASDAFTVLSMAMSGGSNSAASAKLSALQTGVSIGASLYKGSLSQGTFSSRYYQWDVETTVSNLGFRVDSKYWLDDTRTEHAFGSLYLGSTESANFTPTSENPDLTYSPNNRTAPRIYNSIPGNPNSFYSIKSFKAANGSNAKIASSDMYIHVKPTDNYSNVVGATHIAYDNFNVMSEGISGGIAPFRPDIGSLSQPKLYTFNSSLHNLVPFLKEGTDIDKIQFLYNGQNANRYSHHDDPSFGITHEKHSSFSGVYYGLTSNKLTSNRFESDREGLINKKIVSGKHIEWFTNSEIAGGVPMQMGKFVDSDYYNQTNRSNLPAKGIGGFSITREDGMTYHYALPVYRTQEVFFSGLATQVETKFSKSIDNNKVAMTWLLTSITGPDFVDRGTVGLIDDNDWGYWVKFDYGQTTGYYNLRTPYYGYFSDGTTFTYSVTRREDFYLNSISTRSHIALFPKSFRDDRKSAYSKKQDPSYGHNQEIYDNVTTNPTSSLKLDEIILMKKESYANLVESGFSFAGNLPAEYQMGGSFFALTKVLDVFDINRNVIFNDKIEKNALKRIKFIYANGDSELAKKSINSFSGLPGDAPYIDAANIYTNKKGRLTLERLETRAGGNLKVVPDYVFTYGFNPDYNKDKWDGWGFYKPTGTDNVNSHGTPVLDDLDAEAWSLTSILTPMGSKIDIDYERDDYSIIASGSLVPYETPLLDLDLSDGESSAALTYFNEGEKVNIELQVGVYCYTGTNPLSQPDQNSNLDPLIEGGGSEYTSYSVVLQGVIQNNKIVLSAPFNPYSTCQNGGGSAVIESGTVAKLYKRGGDIRVAEMHLSNEFGQTIKSKYKYKLPSGHSSGVVAKEPEFIKPVGQTTLHDGTFDFPSTPVLYSMVEVFTGYTPATDDYLTKQVYEFETPNSNSVVETKTMISDYVVPGFTFTWNNPVYLKHYFNSVNVKTSRIGKIKSINTYNLISGALLKSSEFNYSESVQNDMGKYTSGSMLSEFLASGGQNDPYVMKLIRTKKIYHPYILSSVVHKAYDNGLRSTVTSTTKGWDFITGIETVKDEVNQYGVGIRNEKVLAYKIYPEMGSKLLNYSNKNMLSQIAASYNYRLDGVNSTGLISANVTTWKGNWTNYRDISSGNYVDQSHNVNVWRTHAQFYWLGDLTRLKSDGSFDYLHTDRFDFTTGAGNANWRKESSVERYDHYSISNEVLTSNDIYLATKMGYKSSYKIAEAVNARYNEIAFSSAEDLDESTNYFGGEVHKGTGIVLYKSKGQTTSTHTGDAVISVSSGSAFVFKPQLQSGKSYRASVWTNSLNGRLYYKHNGGTPILSAAPIDALKVGNWYLLHFDIPNNLSPISSFEVGVASVNGSVLFDDFRFQPTNAIMTCYVQNPLNYLHDGISSIFEYTLNNDNLYSKYEYNVKGELIKTYQETLKYGEKLISEQRTNNRRSFTNQ